MSAIYREVVESARPSRASETRTHEGGIAFVADQWSRLQRFLILGSEGSYYAGPRELTVENLGCVRLCLDADGSRTVETIATVSESGPEAGTGPAGPRLA